MTTDSERRVPKPHHNFVPEYQMSGVPHTYTKLLSNPVLIDDDQNDENGYIDQNDIDNFKFTFDYVTRWFMIHNSAKDNGHNTVRLYFSENAARKAYLAQPDPHYLIIHTEDLLPRFELKCKELWILPDDPNEEPLVSIIAGITSIPSINLPDQTKENGFTGIED